MKHLYCYYSPTRKAWIWLRAPNELAVCAFAKAHGDLLQVYQICRCLFKL